MTTANIYRVLAVWPHFLVTTAIRVASPVCLTLPWTRPSIAELRAERRRAFPIGSPRSGMMRAGERGSGYMQREGSVLVLFITYLVLPTIILWGSWYYRCHFTGEETKAWRKDLKAGKWGAGIWTQMAGIQKSTFLTSKRVNFSIYNGSEPYFSTQLYIKRLQCIRLSYISNACIHCRRLIYNWY